MAHAFPPRTQLSPERQSMLDDAMALKLSRLTSRELIAAIGQGLDLLSQRFSDAPLTVDDLFSDAEDAWSGLKSGLLAELDFLDLQRGLRTELDFHRALIRNPNFKYIEMGEDA